MLGLLSLKHTSHKSHVSYTCPTVVKKKKKVLQCLVWQKKNTVASVFFHFEVDTKLELCPSWGAPRLGSALRYHPLGPWKIWGWITSLVLGSNQRQTDRMCFTMCPCWGESTSRRCFDAVLDTAWALQWDLGHGWSLHGGLRPGSVQFSQMDVHQKGDV